MSDPLRPLESGMPGEQYCHMGPRIAELEGRMDMLAANLAGHAIKEQGQYSLLYAETMLLRGQVREIDGALRNFFGTDYAPLSDDFKGAKRFSERLLEWLARKAKLIGIILGAAAAGASLLHYGQSKGEEVPTPPDHGSAEQRAE